MPKIELNNYDNIDIEQQWTTLHKSRRIKTFVPARFWLPHEQLLTRICLKQTHQLRGFLYATAHKHFSFTNINDSLRLELHNKSTPEKILPLVVAQLNIPPSFHNFGSVTILFYVGIINIWLTLKNMYDLCAFKMMSFTL